MYKFQQLQRYIQGALGISILYLLMANESVVAQHYDDGQYSVTSHLEFTFELSLTFNNHSFIYNDHVGNDWFYYVQVDDESDILHTLFVGEKLTLTLSPDYPVTLICHLQETKERYNDKAVVERSFTMSEILATRGKSIDIPVIIKEQHGRYAGNTAKSRFQINVN